MLVAAGQPARLSPAAPRFEPRFSIRSPVSSGDRHDVTYVDSTATLVANTPAWLGVLNEYRAAALLPPVLEDLTFQSGCINHSTYCVKNNVLVHAEDPTLPYYTVEGDQAGRSGNVMASSTVATSDLTAIDLWMAAPFHALGILDPTLERVGYGSYRELKAGFQMAATLDVLRGRNPARSATFPVIWPANGKAMPARCSGGTRACYNGGESPDPLTSCPGYTTPSGLPLVVQLGKGAIVPNVTSHSLLHNGIPLEHCVFDETTYTNPDASMQNLGRSVLGGRDAIVLIPRAPLEKGQLYTAAITANGVTHTWTFGVGFAARHPPPDADYDDDRRDDVAVFRSTGEWFVIPSSIGAGVQTYWGTAGDVPVPGDYDGDGKTDRAVYRPSEAAWYVLQSTTLTGTGVFWGLPGDVPVPADYDGDGKTDFAVYRPSTGVWYIVGSTTSVAYGVYWGIPGDVPIPADFDGDGKADPTVFRPSTSTWFQLLSTTGTGFAVTWGAPGDVPLAGDYDGDGKADPTVFRPSSGTWFQLRSTGGPWFAGYWGVSGDVPIVGDYDGDGKADLTVFRPSTSTWYQLRSMTGLGFAIVWGIPGDLPM